MTVRSFKRAHQRRLDRAARRAAILGRRGRLLAGATLGATTLLAANAQAATYVVNTNADSSDGSCGVSPNPCSLRDAIAAANGDGTADTITFDPSVTGAIDLGGQLDITTSEALTIQGPGSGSLTISGQGSSGIFEISSSGGPSPTDAKTISGLTLTDGSNGDPGGAVSDLTFQPLVLSDDSITNSTTTGSDNDGGGGGVFAEGPTTIRSSTISGNTAEHGGGVEINPKYASIDEPKYGLPLTIENSTIAHNHATGGSSAGPSYLSGGGGVAAYGSTLVLNSSTVTGNTSAISGGGILDLSKYGMQLSHSKLTGNTAALNGGAISDEGWVVGKKYDPTEISASTISGNRAHNGGGMSVVQYGFNGYSSDETPTGQPITIQSSTFSRNHALHGIGGPGSPPRSFGGGIVVFGELASPFRLVDSTLSGNTADRGGGISLGGEYNDPLFYTDPTTGQTGSVTLENSTIAGNTANAFHGGGGVYLGGYVPHGSTAEQSGTAGLESTIVAGNRSHGVANDIQRSGGSTTGGFTGSFDLVQHSAAPLKGSHLIIGKNPQLGALANNGGPTETMKPAGASPVIDQGHAGLGVQTDQRGKPRTVDTAIPNPLAGDGTDIGAVELSNGQVVPPPKPGFSARVGGQLLGGSNTPLLIDGVTPVTCHVNAGVLAACALEVTAKGRTLAAGGIPANKPKKRLTTTVNSSQATQRYLLKHYPLGVVASADAVGLASGPASAVGPVRLLGGPSITLPLGTGSTKFSQKVGTELAQAAKLLAGTKQVKLTSDSSTQAAAVQKRLTNDGVKAQIKIRVSKNAPDHQITITFQY